MTIFAFLMLALVVIYFITPIEYWQKIHLHGFFEETDYYEEPQYEEQDFTEAIIPLEGLTYAVARQGLIMKSSIPKVDPTPAGYKHLEDILAGKLILLPDGVYQKIVDIQYTDTVEEPSVYLYTQTKVLATHQTPTESRPRKFKVQNAKILLPQVEDQPNNYIKET